MGPHWMTVRDPGNAYTRQPNESYVSPAFDLQGRAPMRIEWDAQTPPNTALKFQLRWASSRDDLERAAWHGPTGCGSYYEMSGLGIRNFPAAPRWLQYRAVFVSLYGCASAQLHEVRLICQEGL
jgi:hypothetical protein